MKYHADTLPPAIPLWIGGHAFLTMARDFAEVRDAGNGEVIRRVPLCGDAEIDAAIEAASAVAPTWAARTLPERQALLQALASELARYADHFAGLLRQECGCEAAAAAGEVAAAISTLAAGEIGDAGMLALAVGRETPLVTLARQLALIARAGGTVICKPDPATASAVLALCELTARAGWPAGVVNLVHGDHAVWQALAARPEISRLLGANDEETTA